MLNSFYVIVFSNHTHLLIMLYRACGWGMGVLVYLERMFKVM